MISALTLLLATTIAFAQDTKPRPDPTRSPEAVLGFECIDQTQEDIAARTPGLKLPGKQYVMVSRIATKRFAESAALNAGDFLVKVDGKAIKSVDDLSEVLAKLELPGEVKVEFLDITAGPKPRTKRETVTVKAVKPAPAPQPSRPSVPKGSSAPVEQVTPNDPKLEAEYDKFKDTTRVSLAQYEITKSKYAPAEFDVGYVTSFPGKTWQERPEVRLQITSSNSEWRFLRRDLTLYLLIDDDKPVEVPNAHYGNKIMSGPNFCWEYMSWTIEPALVARLRQAKQVECKLWIVEFELPKAAIAGFGDFEAAIDNLRSGGAAGAPADPN